jgi:predicted nucleic acid-binding protein
MAASILADTGFLVALVSVRDAHHRWTQTVADRYPPPWHSCDAVLSEVFFLVGARGIASVAELIRRSAIRSSFRFAEDAGAVLDLMQKYKDVPMAFADACLVRMSERQPDSLVLTTDNDFRIYRRQNRRTVPCLLP